MKKEYIEPEIEFVSWMAEEAIAADSVTPNMSGGHDDYDPWA